MKIKRHFAVTYRPHLQNGRVSEARNQHETGSNLGLLLHLLSPVDLHGVMLNWLWTGTTSPVTFTILDKYNRKEISNHFCIEMSLGYHMNTAQKWRSHTQMPWRFSWKETYFLENSSSNFVRKRLNQHSRDPRPPFRRYMKFFSVTISEPPKYEAISLVAWDIWGRGMW
jgi:hypothetical protein